MTDFTLPGSFLT